MWLMVTSGGRRRGYYGVSCVEIELVTRARVANSESTKEASAADCKVLVKDLKGSHRKG